MGFITYKQADSRWGKKNYNGSSTMATAGCGSTACAMIAYGIDGKTTPLDTMKYMQSHGYAIRNNGTAWNGIPACLKAYGLQNVQDVPNMTKCWELMSQGYVGVFLFRKGSRGGITWTTSGHYIAVTDYKVQNGKHYIYTRDSGGRNHTGWYCYETQMQGLLPKIWLGSMPKAAPKPASTPAQSTSGKIYTGAFPTKTIKKGSKGTQVTRWQNFLKWMGYDLKADGKFGSITTTKTKAAQKKFGFTGKDIDGIVGPKTIKKAKAYQKPVSSSNTVTPTPTPTPTPAPAPTPSDLPKKCIDVSYWQGKISQANWEKIRKSCGYAICRTSYTSQSKFSLGADSTFATNFTNAKAAGLKVGAYHYSQAITVAEAKAEAEFMCNILKNYTPTFYVVCDFEYGGRLNSKIGKKASDIANAFCDVVKAHGYSPCIYANTSTLNNNLTNPKYPVWVAQYASSCTYKGSKVMWQYTSSGRVDGISASNTNSGSANVDLSYVYSEPVIKPIPESTPTHEPTPEPIPEPTPEPVVQPTPTVTKPTGKYDAVIPPPTLKKGSKGAYVVNLQKFLNWYCAEFDLQPDGDFGNLTDKAVKTFQKTEGISDDGVFGNQSLNKALVYATNAAKLISKMAELAWPYGTDKAKYAYKTGAPTAACKAAMNKHKYNTKAKWSDCGNGVNTVVRETGIDSKYTSLHAVKTAFPKTEKMFDVVLEGKPIPSGFLKPGDQIRYKKTNNDQHAMFYYGDGKVCDAGHYSRFLNIRADEKRYAYSNVKTSTIQVLRVKE